MARSTNNIRNTPKPLLAIVAVAAIVLIVVLGRFFLTAATINVTVNGTALSLHGAKTMETAIRESGLPINPGDLISLNGNILKKSAGYPFDATVNDTETTDPDYQLHNGDVITVTDGKDMLEDYDAEEIPLPHGGSLMGLGAICTIEPGIDGITENRTGRLSGEFAQKTKVPATDATSTRYNPDVGDDKVIALTFDDGPDEEYTEQILEVLRDNEAKATFFCMGKQIDEHPELVQQERSEGHQVCSATYDLSWSSILVGKDKGTLADTDTLVYEVERGQQALSDALEGETISRYVRIPVSNLDGDMLAAVDTVIDAEIGWNIDTADWITYSSSEIYDVLMDLEPGDVVLMHDGGDDCSATVKALKDALPKLKKKGYSFITIDELITYPAQ